MLLVASVAATACAGPGAAPADSGAQSAPIAFEEWAAHEARVVCAKSFDCCTDDELTGFGDDYASEAACRAAVENDLRTRLVEPLAPSIEAGRIRFDGRAAADCSATYVALACSELPSVTASNHSCSGTFVPLAPLGGDCGTNSDCIEGRCAGATGEALGTCEAWRGVGDPCTALECARELSCKRGDDGVQRCAEPEPLLPDGAACEGFLECASYRCEGGVCVARSITCAGR